MAWKWRVKIGQTLSSGYGFSREHLNMQPMHVGIGVNKIIIEISLTMVKEGYIYDSGAERIHFGCKAEHKIHSISLFFMLAEKTQPRT